MIRAVLFDLDDTLFDHRESAAEALRRVQEAHDCFRESSFEEFERQHARLLEEMHPEVVSGRIEMDDARRLRFRRLFERFGVSAAEDICAATAAMYRREYLAARRATAGAEALLEAVRRTASIGIVSNNMLLEQQEKLEYCRLAAFVDVLVVSEEAGVSKPDPAIFQIALDALRAGPSEAVMVGDSWTADVVGARAAGVSAIWFNPLRLPSPEPDAAVPELHSLVPTPSVLKMLLG